MLPPSTPRTRSVNAVPSLPNRSPSVDIGRPRHQSLFGDPCSACHSMLDYSSQNEADLFSFPHGRKTLGRPEHSDIYQEHVIKTLSFARQNDQINSRMNRCSLNPPVSITSSPTTKTHWPYNVFLTPPSLTGGPLCASCRASAALEALAAEERDRETEESMEHR